ncbi:anther-specific proline-rich protein APG-like [Panicum hallii]|uniref:anther-specific proline-rich protein APG-like n=1 Tax=Panicum hallii TaxID=206008 RepID=UPI000DF4DAE9|nr:anther-specific proline-rich protein APG-like [Panicum hallii]
MDLPPPSPQRDPSMDPPPIAQRDPSMSPQPKQRKNPPKKALPPPPPKAKKNPTKKKEKPPPPKLAYEKTGEELGEQVSKEVRDHFAPRKPKPKGPVDPAGQKFFIGICQLREKERLSDYDRSIIKSY